LWFILELIKKCTLFSFEGIIGTTLSVYKETVTLISVYNTDSSYGAVLYKTKYKKLYYHSALMPFDIMT